MKVVYIPLNIEEIDAITDCIDFVHSESCGDNDTQAILDKIIQIKNELLSSNH